MIVSASLDVDTVNCCTSTPVQVQESQIAPWNILPSKETCVSAQWNKVAFCALKFVVFDFLPVSLHYTQTSVSFWTEFHLNNCRMTKQLQASVMKAGRLSETWVFALFCSASSRTERLVFLLLSSPRPRWLSWGIISAAVSAAAAHF